MNPTRAMIENTITTAALNMKAYAHLAQGNLLRAQAKFQGTSIDDKKDTLFGHAYGQVGQVSCFPVDTDPAKNFELDGERLKDEAKMAYSRVVEMKTGWTGIKPAAKDKNAYDDGVNLLDEVIANMDEALRYAETAYDATRSAEKLKVEESAAIA